MSKSNLIEYMKRYLFAYYVGTSTNTIGRIWCKIKAVYWNRRFQFMTEGDIIDRYYALTTKTEVMELCHKN